MLTIKEIADQLQMPATTLRGYRDEFDEFLPHEGEGRFRRYSYECIQLLLFSSSKNLSTCFGNPLGSTSAGSREFSI